MGPFELMDMIGLDVNFAVTCSVWRAYFNDPRYTPSLIQRDLVDAGFPGQKDRVGASTTTRTALSKHCTRYRPMVHSCACWHRDLWRLGRRRRRLATAAQRSVGAIRSKRQ
jgi:3-hydroxyacyl-CoA dehydrogenase